MLSLRQRAVDLTGGSNCSAIAAAAFAAAFAASEPVMFPAGRYRLASPLTFPAGSLLIAATLDLHPSAVGGSPYRDAQADLGVRAGNMFDSQPALASGLSGGPVHFGPGDYRLASPLVVAPGVMYADAGFHWQPHH